MSQSNIFNNKVPNWNKRQNFKPIKHHLLDLYIYHFGKNIKKDIIELLLENNAAYYNPIEQYLLSIIWNTPKDKKQEEIERDIHKYIDRNCIKILIECNTRQNKTFFLKKGLYFRELLQYIYEK